MSATSAFDLGFLARVEDAGINASAPREQIWMDGWLLRFCPGKAKRARCVQAVAAGRGSVESKVARCRRLYDAAGLRLYVRITPFSEPGGLDARLEVMGMGRIDDTRVMVAPVSAIHDIAPASVLPVGLRYERTDAAGYVQWVGAQRGSSASEQRAHLDRLQSVPVTHRAILVVDADGQAVAGGQVALEDDVAGLYDVFTAESARNRGLAGALCRHLAHEASAAGASTVYLQVDAANDAARRVYKKLGFTDAYSYHYRSPSSA